MPRSRPAMGLNSAPAAPASATAPTTASGAGSPAPATLPSVGPARNAYPDPSMNESPYVQT